MCIKYLLHCFIPCIAQLSSIIGSWRTLFITEDRNI